MRIDGRIDMTKLTAAFRNFANAPKEVKINIFSVSRYLNRVT